MKSTMFLLFGITHYEGGEVLGVFSSYDKAVFTLEERKVEIAVDRINNRYNLQAYDDYSITEFIVDDTHSALNS